jgi:hypothetical protein
MHWSRQPEEYNSSKKAVGGYTSRTTTAKVEASCAGKLLIMGAVFDRLDLYHLTSPPPLSYRDPRLPSSSVAQQTHDAASATVNSVTHFTLVASLTTFEFTSGGRARAARDWCRPLPALRQCSRRFATTACSRWYVPGLKNFQNALPEGRTARLHCLRTARVRTQ